MVELVFSEELRNEYPDVFVPYATISGVQVTTSQSPEFKAKLAEISLQIREKYTLENLKDDKQVRKYRKFFWRLGIDPTKTRTSASSGWSASRKSSSAKSRGVIHLSSSCSCGTASP